MAIISDAHEGLAKLVGVHGGAGTARLGEIEQPLREDISLTLFQGEPLDLEAAAEGAIDLFMAEIDVDLTPQERLNESERTTA